MPRISIRFDCIFIFGRSAITRVSAPGVSGFYTPLDRRVAAGIRIIIILYTLPRSMHKILNNNNILFIRGPHGAVDRDTGRPRDDETGTEDDSISDASYFGFHRIRIIFFHIFYYYYYYSLAPRRYYCNI